MYSGKNNRIRQLLPLYGRLEMMLLFRRPLRGVLRFLMVPIFVLALCHAPALGAGEEGAVRSEPLAEQLRERFKTESFSLGILLQTQGAFSFEDTDFNGGRAWDLGSTRIDFRGTVDRNFTYRVRVYFLSQQQSIDARVGYRFSDNLQVVAGAFKPYLSRELDPSPANLDFVRRARLVGAMMNTLEIGASVIGEAGPLQYRFGMYNGSGVAGVTAIAEQNDNRFLYTGRLALVVEPSGGHELELGLNGAYNGSRDEDVGNTGLTSKGGRVLYGGYASYDGSVFFGTAEFMQSRFDVAGTGNGVEDGLAVAAGPEETITGMYATAGVRVAERHAVLVRWDYLGFDLRGDTSDRILLGWNYDPTSLVSFRVNALADFSDHAGTQFGLSGVFQYHF
ncbi:MAG: hypothetical protein EA363_13380 [Balneolaceae bacterium]|nr:MAG: hypothetical protein EA363_13380 [Balneolaceae bacterium]